MATRLERQMAFIKLGDVCYEEDDYTKALDFFKMAVLICECNKRTIESAKSHGVSVKDIPLPSCCCKDYLSLPPTREALSDLAKALCSCGSGIKLCPSQAHHQALGRISGVYERRKDHNTALEHLGYYKIALQFATMLVTVAPCKPEGYLKMAKLFRLCNSIPTTLCNLLYIQASRQVPTGGADSIKLGKALCSVIRRDIVASLPRELSVMVLKHLSQGDLSCRAMAVTKTWRNICRDPALWRHLCFVKNLRQPRLRQALRPGVLNDIVHKRSAQLATTVTIDGLWDFGFDGAQLGAILKTLSNLKTLNITGRRGVFWTGASAPLIRPSSTSIPDFREFWKAICCNAPSTLTHISLAGFDVGHYEHQVHGVFAAFEHDWLVGTNFAKSLESLSLTNMTPGNMELVLVGTLCRNQFPRLETLSLVGTKYDRDATGRNLLPFIALGQLAHCTPKLKDITLSLRFQRYQQDYKPDFITHLVGSGHPWESHVVPWAELRRLELGVEGNSYNLPEIPVSDALRVLELEVDGFEHSEVMSQYHDSQDCTSFPRGLEHVLVGPGLDEGDEYHNSTDLLDFDSEPPTLTGDNIMRWLKPSIDSGSLRSLDTAHTLAVQISLDEIFMHRKAILESLSCRRIDIEDISSYPGGYWEDTISWIATFPNLKVVGLYPREPDKYHEKGWMIVTRFMELRPDVRTIYTNVLRGAIRDEVLARAASRGVTIVEAPRVPEPALQFPPPAPWKAVVIEEEENANGLPKPGVKASLAVV